MNDAFQLVIVSGVALVALVALARPMWRRRATSVPGASCDKCASGPSAATRSAREPVRPR